jgi:hypothetical protein
MSVYTFSKLNPPHLEFTFLLSSIPCLQRVSTNLATHLGYTSEYPLERNRFKYNNIGFVLAEKKYE